MKYLKIILIVSFLFSITITAQNTQTLKEINNQVYSKFYKAYEKLDYTLMEEIHDESLTRIPANQNQILDYTTYMANYKNSFADLKEKGITNNIELRFFERICNDSTASDRGIYKFTVDKGKEDEKNYYGKFFVLLKKINGKWKIVIDYDSNENNTIDEENYLDAYSIDNFESNK